MSEKFSIGTEKPQANKQTNSKMVIKPISLTSTLRHEILPVSNVLGVRLHSGWIMVHAPMTNDAEFEKGSHTNFYTSNM